MPSRACEARSLTCFPNCGALRDLVQFVQFKKREKDPWRSVTFSQSATLVKATLLHGCFLRLLNCAHGTKSRNAPQLLSQAEP